MPRKRSESENQDEIRGYMESRGFLCLRYGSGGTSYTDNRGRTRFVKYGVEGGSDLIGSFPINGYSQFIAIEVKTQTEWKRITKNYNVYWNGYYDKQDVRHRYKKQIEFIEDVKSKGGIGIFAWNWKQVLDEIEMFIRSKQNGNG